MLRRTLNLGILAHVDAGKTTLTERLLYAAGVIDEIGSVDKGTTQTDTLTLERQRGITIKSAVASFAIDDVTVNLIDTPGHPDFIAEVERVLSVLDGAVLVISAVEGVQPQTRILMRVLRRLNIPTLLFVNKIDCTGANDERVLQAISERLALAIVPMGITSAPGTRAADFRLWSADDTASLARIAEVLAERDDGILAAYVEAKEGLSYRRLREAVAAQTKRALVHPVFFGSAITGAGVESLMAGIAELLPTAVGDAEAEVSASVFKIERGGRGERVAYVRMFSGTVRTRDRLRFGDELQGKVTAISVFDRGTVALRTSVSAGEIGKVSGLQQIQIGDWIGVPRTDGTQRQFAPPTQESVVVAGSPEDRARLRVALGQLAEQDPLINVRQDATVNEMSVSLYGEVQKEVVQSTLANDFGIEVTFRETTTIYIERPVGIGTALDLLQDDENPFSATVGLRLEPAPIGSGVAFRLDIDRRSVPTHIYRNADRFIDLMTQYICRTLQKGLYGWQVTDCVVTMTECGYYASDGPTKPTANTSRTTAADFRRLTPVVLMRALERAKTRVCEPMIHASIEMPSDTVTAVVAAIARLGGSLEPPSVRGDLSTVATTMPAARAQVLRRQLPSLTGGEGIVETNFGGHRPVSGAPPARGPTNAGQLNRAENMTRIARRTGCLTQESRDTSE